MNCLYYDHDKQRCSCLRETKCEGCHFFKLNTDIKSRKELSRYYRSWLGKVESKYQVRERTHLIRAGFIERV